MREIELPCNLKALVDDEDYEMLMVHNWFLSANGNVIYAATRINKRVVRMHQLIFGCPGGVIDHRDGDGLNNQRYNLRKCSHAENMRNRKRPYYGKNDYRGIEFDTRKSRWRSVIIVDGKKFRGKRFHTQLEAAIDYNRLAKIHHGEFASLNLI